jgi:general secretion pathway protein J
MNPPSPGFTLLELLVALAVFSIMAVAAYSGLRNVLYTRAAVDAQSQRLAAVQLAMFRLEQDIEQLMPRGIRDEYGEPQAALLGDNTADDRLILTRSGWDNPLGQPRASSQRVAYRLREGRLWRLHWPVLDRGGRIEPSETLLLDRVRVFKVRFRDPRGEWRADWPPPSVASEPAVPVRREATDPLPSAVEISLNLEDWGEITRLLLPPG